MYPITSDQAANDYAAGLIRFKAQQLCRRPGFTRSDRHDIEQELLLDLIQRLPAYDPKKAQLNTFISRIVSHNAARLARHQDCEMRDPRREACSLNEMVPDDDGQLVERHETIVADSDDRLRQCELRSDVSTVLRDLPDDLRAIAIGLGQGKSVNAIAAELKVSRSAVQNRIPKLRAHFERQNLQEYL